MTTQLEVQKREQSATAVRSTGYIPGIVYGPKQEPINVAVEALSFGKLLQNSGESTIITLIGLDEEIEVLIQDVSFNAAKGGAEHVDFYAIERGKELTTNVSLEFIGEAPVEKQGMMINKAVQEVEVTCRPSVLPSHIDVDVSVLVDANAQIHVSDLQVAEGVTINLDADMLVAGVAEQREEEPEEETAEVDMSAVEVEQKGKQEEGEGEADA